EIKSNKEEIISQHEIILDIIKNRKIHMIKDYINIHIIKPTEDWIEVDKINDDIENYLKK
ncbi:hypothetical protein, partial [Romboutsia sp.]|uniref:hypothetical protein n=1 Tax=Romboutsia sp. TaxID=1965302 RepID=UPI003F3A6301